MGYSAGWNSTDQIPQRAVDAGTDRPLRRDRSDRRRQAPSATASRADDAQRFDDGEFKLNAYAIRSKLEPVLQLHLLPRAPIDLDPPIDGDQFEQAEQRTVFGLAASRSWNMQLGGHDTSTRSACSCAMTGSTRSASTATVARQRAVDHAGERRCARPASASTPRTQTQWTPWLRSVAGVRADRFDFDVASSIPENSGKQSASLASPKLSLIFGPWAKTEFFVNYGWGFHSNDARGATEPSADRSPPPTRRSDPPSTPSPLLVRSKGGELGLRTEVVPGLQSSLALWQLKLGSELVFVGDAGDTEPSRASQRRGIEWNNHYIAAPWLLRRRRPRRRRTRASPTDDPDDAGRLHPRLGREGRLARRRRVTDCGPWFGQFQLRYFGPRPLIEDNSQRSKATTLAYLRARLQGRRRTCGSRSTSSTCSTARRATSTTTTPRASTASRPAA